MGCNLKRTGKSMKKNMKSKLLAGHLFFWIVVAAGCGSPQIENQMEVAQSNEQNQQEETLSEQQVVEAEKPQFPIELDEKQLQLGSVFESTVMNPDCDDAYGEDIATIQLKNASGKYLKSAKIQVTVSNGDVFNFLVQDVPADMEIMAFDVDNQTYDDTYYVQDTKVEAVYGEYAANDAFTWKVNGSEITVENKSGDKKENITIYYHCMLENLGYGGKTYELTIGSLKPGESQTVTDQYCFVGDVRVSNITCD